MRRPLIIVVFLVGASLLTGFLLLNRNLSFDSFPANFPFFKTSNLSSSTNTVVSDHIHQKTVDVAIIETNGWHEEVFAAFTHAFGSQPNVQLRLYPTNSRFGMPEIVSNFQLSHAVPAFESTTKFNDNSTTPDVLILTTGELDTVHLEPRLKELLAGGQTYLYCVVHHADQWSDPKIQKLIAPWLDRDLVEFITLSPHTAAFLSEDGLKEFSSSIPIIKTITPLFPIPAPSPNRKGIIDKQHELAFAIQGNYEPSRRDFDNIFSHLQSFVRASESTTNERKGPNVTLHLLGSGTRPSVPADLASHVFFDEDLTYDEYYAVLSNTFAMLPAFADKSYLDRKASSSVPASLLGGTPLVATKDLLSAYSYLPTNAVYLQEDGETELNAVGRILKLSEGERKDKSMQVRKACSEIMESNVKLVATWIEEAKIKLDRAR